MDEGGTWAGTRRRLRADAQRLRSWQEGKFGYSPATWFLEPAWVCVLLHRLSHYLWLTGRTRVARLCMQANSLLTGADIQPASDLGAGLLIPSPCGVNISARAGENLCVSPLAGIGGSVRDRDVGAGIGLPLLGRDVTVGWFNGVQGSITVGDGATFGPGVGAVVNVAPGKHMALRMAPKEVPAGEHEASPPLRAGRPCDHRQLASVRRDIGADVDRYIEELCAYMPAGYRPPRLSAALTNPVLALALYRHSHRLHLKGWRRTAMALCQLNILLNKLTIPPGACIGAGVFMPHLAGTLFHGVAGERLTQFAGAVCASREPALGARCESAPWLGHGVLVAGHAGAFGPIEVGDGAQLGPKAQLMADLPAGSQLWDPLGRGSVQEPGEDVDAAPREVSDPGSQRLEAAHARARTQERLRMDRERSLGLPSFPAYTCAWLHRMSHLMHSTGRPRRARFFWLANIWLTGADITPACEIGGGMLVPYPAGVSLHCRAGTGLTVGANAGVLSGIDPRGCPASIDASPWLGDGVHVDTHAAILGAVKIGDGVVVSPGCIVTRSTPAHVRLAPRKQRIRTGDAVHAARTRAAAARGGAPV
jgi:serine O-acetyltransferase